MTEAEVLEIVLQVFEAVLKKHEENGRHEINRSDLAAAIVQLKGGGLSVASPAVQKLF